MTTRTLTKGRSGHMPIKRSLIVAVIACLCVLAIAAFAGVSLIQNTSGADALRSEIVNLNKFTQDSSPENTEAIAQAQASLRRASDTNLNGAICAVILVFAASVLCLLALSTYLYISVIRPFAKLQGFAEQVASGNLDLPLKYEKSNPFGRFAWAFDHMRIELKRARASERAAIEENKSVMASLAHDLRTPVASIRAYSEALSIGLAESEEERREYVEVIDRRCIEVSQLVNDMLTHSLAELDRISVECSAVPASPLLHQVVKDFGLLEPVSVTVEDAVLHADALRLRQAIENLLVNVSKYAPGKAVEVTGRCKDEDNYQIEVRDYGPGMDDADIPFAFTRFYRGSNAHEVPGSDLGLYVVRYVVDRMGGEVTIAQAHPGISVRLSIPIEKSNAS